MRFAPKDPTLSSCSRGATARWSCCCLSGKLCNLAAGELVYSSSSSCSCSSRGGQVIRAREGCICFAVSGADGFHALQLAKTYFICSFSNSIMAKCRLELLVSFHVCRFPRLMQLLHELRACVWRCLGKKTADLREDLMHFCGHV